MSVTIRLTRKGRHKRPFYRMVVADTESPRDGKFIEILGTYNPLGEEVAVQIKEERAIYWLNQGAMVSDTVKSLFKKSQLFKQAAEQKQKLS